MSGYKRYRDLKYRYECSSAKLGGGHRTVKGRGKKLGAGVDGFAWFSQKIFDASMEVEVDARIEKHYPEMKKILKNHTGVLVVLQYEISKNADFKDCRLLSVMLGDGASNFRSALRKWQQSAHFIKAPTDWLMQYGPQEYLWFIEDKNEKDGLKNTDSMK